MPVTVQLPNVLAKLTDGQRTVEATGDTVGDLVTALSRQFPELEARLRDRRGQPYEFVAFYLNDADIRLNGGFDTAVRDGDELVIVPSVAGG
ncbi:MAG: MoaD/ThiS family protein [Gemmatimonadota bacterium]|nr:MAG: MoaD/ThiS family protein [Gemmatimonadota bacterium]